MLGNSRRRTIRTNLVLGGLLLSSFLLMTFDIQSNEEGLAQTLRSGAQDLFAPVQSAVAVVVDPVAELVTGIAELSTLRADNERLQSEIDRLEASVAGAERVKIENEQLRSILNLPLAEATFSAIPADVIAGSDSFDAGFTINRGLNDGLVVGAAVLDANGVYVGEIKEIFDATAVVAPVFASREAIEIVTPSGDVGFVAGTGDSNFGSLTVFSTVSPLEPGDVLFTTVVAEGSITPAGLPVATVADRIAPEAQAVLDARVELLADFERLFVVQVVQVTIGSGVPADEPASESDDEGGEAGSGEEDPAENEG